MTDSISLTICLILLTISLAAIIVLLILLSGAGKKLAKEFKTLEKLADSLADRSDSLSEDIEETRRDIRESRLDLERSVQLSVSSVKDSVESGFARNDRQSSELRASVDAQLDRMRATVDEKLQKTLDERLASSFAGVRDSLDQVYRGLGEMQGLAQGVGDLKKVLTNVKTRGILGEVQLKAILEQILASDQYAENTQIDPKRAERVEFAVKLPGDGTTPVLLPVDSKFPGDTYAALVNAYEKADAQAIAECRKNLALVVRKCAKDIHDKYIAVPYSTEFAVMFLPFEGLYSEVVNMGLMEILQRDFQVMVAGPSTMAALLNSLQMGFKAFAIRKNAGRVWKVLGSVKSEFDKFAEVLEATQQRLDQANKELDRLVGTRTRMIQRSLSEVQSLGGGEDSESAVKDIVF